MKRHVHRACADIQRRTRVMENRSADVSIKRRKTNQRKCPRMRTDTSFGLGVGLQGPVTEMLTLAMICKVETVECIRSIEIEVQMDEGHLQTRQWHKRVPSCHHGVGVLRSVLHSHCRPIHAMAWFKTHFVTATADIIRNPT